MLGQALLVLIGLAVVLLTLILLLAEANYILHLGGKLVRRWKSGGSDPDGPGSPTAAKDDAEHAPREQEAR